MKTPSVGEGGTGLWNNQSDEQRLKDLGTKFFLQIYSEKRLNLSELNCQLIEN